MDYAIFGYGMENKSSFFNDILKLLPFFGGYIILYGAFYMTTYYSQFSLPIIHYITFSEIISFFINDISLIFQTAILLAFMVYVNASERQTAMEKLEKQADRYFELQKIIKQYGDENVSVEVKGEFEFLEKMFNDSTEISTLNWIKRRWRPIVLILGLFLVVIFTLYMLFPAEYLKAFLLAGLITIVGIGSAYFFRDYKVAIAVTIMISLILVSFISAWFTAFEVKRGKYVGIIFSTKTSKIASDSTNYFIGKTQGYIFYYRSKEKRTIVYPADQVDSLSIPNK